MGILAQAKAQQIAIRECGEGIMKLSPSEFVLIPMYFNWGYAETDSISLRDGVLEKLRDARKNLPQGWDFKIWDGFRTLKTQKILYDNYRDELKTRHPDWTEVKLREAVEIFVSPPSTDPLYPAPHNTGGAVDLTIVDGNGKELDMGTAFDEFEVKSFTDHFKEGEFFENRRLLKDVLEGAGFKNYHEEWWHFSYGDQEWARQTGEKFAIYGSIEL